MVGCNSDGEAKPNLWKLRLLTSGGIGSIPRGWGGESNASMHEEGNTLGF